MLYLTKRCRLRHHFWWDALHIPAKGSTNFSHHKAKPEACLRNMGSVSMSLAHSLGLCHQYVHFIIPSHLDLKAMHTKYETKYRKVVLRCKCIKHKQNLENVTSRPLQAVKKCKCCSSNLTNKIILEGKLSMLPLKLSESEFTRAVSSLNLYVSKLEGSNHVMFLSLAIVVPILFCSNMDGRC